MTRQYNDEDIRSYRHPSEDSSFHLIVLLSVALFVSLIWLALSSYEVVLIVLVSMVILSIIMQALVLAYLGGNAAKVSEDNFPDLYKILEETKYSLNYTNTIDIYVANHSDMNRFLSNFFGINYMFLNSEVLEEMLQENNKLHLKWIISRYVATQKLKSLRLGFLTPLFNSLINIKILNLVLLPYERAVQLSGDNLGLVLCDDFQEILKAFNLFLVGKKLAKRIKLEAMLEQGRQSTHSILAAILRVFSYNPSLVERFLNLIAFARAYSPEEYRTYLSQLGVGAQIEMKHTIPEFYQDRIFSKKQQVSVRASSVKNQITVNKEVRDQIKINKR